MLFSLALVGQARSHADALMESVNQLRSAAEQLGHSHDDTTPSGTAETTTNKQQVGELAVGSTETLPAQTAQLEENTPETARRNGSSIITTEQKIDQLNEAGQAGVNEVEDTVATEQLRSLARLAEVEADTGDDHAADLLSEVGISDLPSEAAGEIGPCQIDPLVHTSATAATADTLLVYHLWSCAASSSCCCSALPAVCALLQLLTALPCCHAAHCTR